MSSIRIHVFGASGSGTTTLGKALAEKLSVKHLDADNYYWQQTDPPYILERPPEERVRLLLRDMSNAGTWILSGSVVSGGDAFIRLFSLAIFVTLPSKVRVQRLKYRERERYGARIEVGGDMHKQSQTFLAWAARYDEAGAEIRSRALHERWLEHLPCPVVRVQTLKSSEEIVEELQTQS